MIQRLFAKLMMFLAVACGVGSLILFVAYPVGSNALVRMQWPLSGILVWDGLLCLAFFLQHSSMVRKGFRDRISGFIPRHYHRAVYSIASGLVLTGVVFLWQPSDTHVFVIDGPFRLAAYAGALIAIAVFVWGAFALRGMDPFGLAAIKAHLRGITEAQSELIIRGPYRWVRHPWYAAAIVLFWSCVDLTADRLLFNVLWTGWICIGARLEERDLLHDFGAAYDKYRHNVPMLIPRFRSAVL